jgi:hypothetical protein
VLRVGVVPSLSHMTTWLEQIMRHLCDTLVMRTMLFAIIISYTELARSRAVYLRS